MDLVLLAPHSTNAAQRQSERWALLALRLAAKPAGSDPAIPGSNPGGPATTFFNPSALPFTSRLMVGRRALNSVIGVRVPGGKPPLHLIILLGYTTLS